MTSIKSKLKIVILWCIFLFSIVYLSGKWSMTRANLDSDLLWHLKIGEDIFETGKIALENSYSWIKGTLWTQQEWLFSVILYGIVSMFGIYGFYALHIITQYSFVGLCIHKNKLHFDLLALIIFSMAYWWLPLNAPNRPAEFSTYFFVLMVFLYDKQFKWKPVIYFICGLFLANFHCGAAVPLLALMALMFLADALLNILLLKRNSKPTTMTKRFIVQYVISCICFISALFINPYGYKQVVNMFGVMNLNSTQYINEWRPFCSDNYFLWIVLCLMAYSIGYGLKKHNWDKDEIIRALCMSAFLVLSFASIKAFIMFLYLYWMYGYKYLDEMIYDVLQQFNLTSGVKIKKMTLSWPEKLPHKKGMYIYSFLIAIAFGIITACYNGVSIDDLIAQYRDNYASEGTVEYLKKASSEAEITGEGFRCLNGYVTGNYLLYFDVPCFIDARQQPYSQEFGWSSAVDDYFGTDVYDFAAMNDFFAKYDFNYVLSNDEYGINMYMQTLASSWTLDYHDGDGNYVWKRIN